MCRWLVEKGAGTRGAGTQRIRFPAEQPLDISSVFLPSSSRKALKSNGDIAIVSAKYVAPVWLCYSSVWIMKICMQRAVLRVLFCYAYFLRCVCRLIKKNTTSMVHCPYSLSILHQKMTLFIRRLMITHGITGYSCTVVQELLWAQRRHTVFYWINVSYLGQWAEF